MGGPIALVKDGDRIIVDSKYRVINWLVDEEEQARRMEEWKASGKGQLREKRGVLFKYARDVAVSLACLLHASKSHSVIYSRQTSALIPTEESAEIVDQSKVVTSTHVNRIGPMKVLVRYVVWRIDKMSERGRERVVRLVP